MAAHSERAHALYSFSNAHRWMQCPGQPKLLERLPELQRPPGKAAKEGTLRHEAAETMLKSGSRDYSNLPFAMRDSVAAYVDHVDVVRAIAPDIVIKHEQRYEYPQKVMPPRDCTGILDTVAYSPSLRIGWVIDFKNGAVPVAAYNNEQLLCGAVAAFHSLPIDAVTMTIIQPNAFAGPSEKHDSIYGYEMLDHMERVDEALRLASQPDAPLIPGDHCNNCPVAAGCFARERLALREIAEVPDACQLPVAKEAYPDPINFSPERIAAILAAIPGLKAWFSDVTAYALEKAIDGAQFPGWKLAETRSARKWEGEPKKIADELIVMSDYNLTVDDVMPRQLISITEAEKRLKEITGDQVVPGQKRKALEDLGNDFAFLTTRASSGNYTLVPESSNRPAVKPAAAAFAHVHVEAPEDQSC